MGGFFYFKCNAFSFGTFLIISKLVVSFDELCGNYILY